MKTTIYEDDKFIKGEIEYTVLKIYKQPNANVALLKRNAYCSYVVALDIKQYKDGSYAWAFGHYFNELQNAYKSYEEYIIKLN